MKIKLDENIPAELADLLRDREHDVDTVIGEGLQGHSDDHVWNAAQRSQRFLITQDLDFSDLRRYTPGTHEGLIVVRLREATRQALSLRLAHVFSFFDPSVWKGCLVVVSEHRIRVRRPKNSQG